MPGGQVASLHALPSSIIDVADHIVLLQSPGCLDIQPCSLQKALEAGGIGLGGKKPVERLSKTRNSAFEKLAQLAPRLMISVTSSSYGYHQQNTEVFGLPDISSYNYFF